MRYLAAAGYLIGFLLLAIICTAIPYGLLWVAIYVGSTSWGFSSHDTTIPNVAVAIIFAAALIDLFRGRRVDPTDLKWDSGTAESAPSRTSISGAGGSLWNMNPFGPNSILSTATVISAFLQWGPLLAIVGCKEACEQLKRKS
jgi:hypothetical protein